MTRSTAAARVGLLGLRRPPTRSTQAAADVTVFEAAYRDCHQELYRYARSIVRDDHAAEDVLQSTMVKALAALQDESRDFELRPWLFRIAHNEAISKLRRERPTDELPDTVPSVQAPVGEQVDRRQTLDELWSDLATLPERQRQALVLRELSGLGHDEIGEVLQTSGRAVKQTIFEARRALLDCSEGRAMVCDEVQATLSDGDGRVRRGRRIQSHLRGCADCRAFDAAMHERPEQLRALAPALPMAAAAGLLAQLVPGGAPLAALGTVGGASAGSSIGAVGGSIASALATKTAVVAVASATIVGAAGVTVVETRQTPSSSSAPDAGSAQPAAAQPGATPPTGLTPAAGALGAGATAATGASTSDARRRPADDRPRPTTGAGAATAGSSSTPGAASAAAQAAAGQARAAERRAAAARRRAAAAERRAAAGKGGNGSAGTSTTKRKNGGGNSGAGANPPKSGGGKTPAKSSKPSSPSSGKSPAQQPREPATPPAAVESPAPAPADVTPPASGKQPGSSGNSGAQK